MANTLPVTIETITYALAGGVLPTLVWLWYWLKEDKINPEPRGLIGLTLVGGAVAVLLAYVIEKAIFTGLSALDLNSGLLANLKLISWAAVEEILKLIIAYVIAFRSRWFDEPVDAMIYLITTALGFAAAENALYLIYTLTEGSAANILIVTGNLRFLGATLLHVVSSATIGGALALAFCRSPLGRRRAITIGLILATILHILFNLFIINATGDDVLKIFAVLWLSAVLVLFLFERVKVVTCQTLTKLNV